MATIRLVVVFLAFSHLICLNAIPITRTGRLMQEPVVHQMIEIVETEAAQMVLEENGKMERRMAVQLNDYPGSGANHRHNPWPPQLAKCADC